MTVTVPVDLCPAHHDIALGWAINDYNPRWPSEWPGGAGLMDSRTSHDERERDWDRKNGEQVELTVRICRSGTSPQCTHPAALAAGLAHLDTHTETR